MPIPVSEITSSAAIALQDEDHVRWPLTELYRWINQGAAEIVLRRPAARSLTEDVPLVLGTLQKIPSGGIELLDIPRNAAGGPVRLIDRQLLDDTVPTWHTMKPAASIKHYSFDERTPTTFYVYPPAREGIAVQMLYSAAPPEIAGIDESIDLDRAYLGPMVSYVLYRAYAKDAETGNAQLAVAHLGAFNDALGSQNEVTAAVSPNRVSV